MAHHRQITPLLFVRGNITVSKHLATGLLFTVALLAAPASCAATLTWGVELNGSATGSTPTTGPITNSFQTGGCLGCFVQQVTYTNSASSSQSGVYLSQTFTGNGGVSGAVSLGNIQGTVSGTASGLIGTNCLFGGTCSEASGQGTLNAHWFDTLTFGGLPSGATEQFLVTSAFAASLLGAAYPGPVNGALADYSLGFGNCNISISFNEATPAANNTQTCILNVISGQSIRVDGQLSIQATGYTLYGPSYGSSASVTILDPTFFLDPITQGASYTSASGVGYASSAVPEPSTLGLLGGAAIVLALLRYRVARTERAVERAIRV